MKKFVFYLIATGLLFVLIPNLSKANSTPTSSIVFANPSDANVAKTLLSRLSEINEIDKSKLNVSEKLELRNEVNSIHNQLGHCNGIYLSVAGLFMIGFMLLILL